VSHECPGREEPGLIKEYPFEHRLLPCFSPGPALCLDFAERYPSKIPVVHVVRTEDFTFPRPATLDDFFEDAQESLEHRIQSYKVVSESPCPVLTVPE
jgi:hypothetical protein